MWDPSGSVLACSTFSRCQRWPHTCCLHCQAIYPSRGNPRRKLGHRGGHPKLDLEVDELRNPRATRGRNVLYWNPFRVHVTVACQVHIGPRHWDGRLLYLWHVSTRTYLQPRRNSIKVNGVAWRPPRRSRHNRHCADGGLGFLLAAE